MIQIWIIKGKEKEANPVEGKVYDDRETAHLHCTTLNRIFEAGNCGGGPYHVYEAQLEVSKQDKDPRAHS